MNIFKRKLPALPLVSRRADGSPVTTKEAGDAAEDQALRHLTANGLRLLERNYRTPGRGGGEIDLVMRDADGTLVFVEVRRRASSAHGGAAASISATKRQRIVLAANRYLMRLRTPPPCRFDVVLLEDGRIDWLRGAFEAS
ncbi:MAG: YraN family protein [Rhodoferax sp.]|nr:YraN family protein [Rhodoferax sp.]